MKPIVINITIPYGVQEEAISNYERNLSEELYIKHNKLFDDNPSIKEKCEKRGSYHFIPYSDKRVLTEFLAIKKWLTRHVIPKDLIIKAKNNGAKRTFVDAGSGIGNVLLMSDLSELSKNCTGIEFNKPTLEMSKSIVAKKKKRFELVLDDIIDYNNYSKFDIIYYYCPFASGLMETYFEELIEDKASIGTIIIPKLKQSKKILEDKRFRKISIVIKSKSKNSTTKRKIYLHEMSIFIKVSNDQRTGSDLPKILERCGLPPKGTKRPPNSSTYAHYLWKKIPDKHKMKIIRFANRYK